MLWILPIICPSLLEPHLLWLDQEPTSLHSGQVHKRSVTQLMSKLVDAEQPCCTVYSKCSYIHCSMSLVVCKQLQRPRMSLLITLVAIVVLFKFIVLYAALPVMFPSLHYAAVKDTFISRQQFSFPEVNQTEISRFPKTSIVQVRGLYFHEKVIPEQQQKKCVKCDVAKFLSNSTFT